MTASRKTPTCGFLFSWIPFALLLLVSLSTSAQQKAAPAVQQKPAAARVAVTTVVTVLGPNFTAPPAMSKEDVNVRVGNVRENVSGWVPAQADRAALDLGILIDEVAQIGTQLDDLRKFIQSQSRTTRVGLFYANNGRAQVVSAFSADHDAVAKSLRLTLGPAYASSSLYFSIWDLMAKFPPTTARREILVIGDGIDRFRGDPFSPDISTTIEKAQRAGIIIHTLYARGVGRAGRNLFRINWGQNNLAQMTDGTGGESFFQGLETPVSFGPFLDQLDMVLHNQYFLTVTTPRSGKPKGELRSLRVSTEQRQVEISAPREIFIPGP